MLDIIRRLVQHRAAPVRQRIQIPQPQLQRPVRSVNVSARRGMVVLRPVRVHCVRVEHIKPARATVRVRHVVRGIIVPVVPHVQRVHHIVPIPQPPRQLRPVLIRVYVWRGVI